MAFRLFKRLEKKAKLKGEIYCVAEVDRHLAANSKVLKGIGCSRHVGLIGIAVKKGFRRFSIGNRNDEALEEHARKIGLKILAPSALANS